MNSTPWKRSKSLVGKGRSEHGVSDLQTTGPLKIDQGQEGHSRASHKRSMGTVEGRRFRGP
jgi:hypothetical protein